MLSCAVELMKTSFPRCTCLLRAFYFAELTLAARYVVA